MEITILSQKKDEIEILIKGETHTLMNIVKAVLVEDDRVETAFYDIKRLPNSVEKEPVLYIKTIDNADPITVLKEVALKIENLMEEFKAKFNAASS